MPRLSTLALPERRAGRPLRLTAPQGASVWSGSWAFRQGRARAWRQALEAALGGRGEAVLRLRALRSAMPRRRERPSLHGRVHDNERPSGFPRRQWRTSRRCSSPVVATNLGSKETTLVGTHRSSCRAMGRGTPRSGRRGRAVLNRRLNQASGVRRVRTRGGRTWIDFNVDEAAAVREAHHVDRSGERARLVTTVLALDEAPLGQAHERTSGSVLADPEVAGDAPDIGDRQQAAVVVDVSVKGDVFENGPCGRPQPSAGLAGLWSHEQAARRLASRALGAEGSAHAPGALASPLTSSSRNKPARGTAGCAPGAPREGPASRRCPATAGPRRRPRLG